MAARPDTLRRPAHNDVTFRTASGTTIVAAGPARRPTSGTVTQRLGSAVGRVLRARTPD